MESDAAIKPIVSICSSWLKRHAIERRRFAQQDKNTTPTKCCASEIDRIITTTNPKKKHFRNAYWNARKIHNKKTSHNTQKTDLFNIGASLCDVVTRDQKQIGSFIKTLVMMIVTGKPFGGKYQQNQSSRTKPIQWASNAARASESETT